MKTPALLIALALLTACGEAPQLRSLSEIKAEKQESAKESGDEMLAEIEARERQQQTRQAPSSSISPKTRRHLPRSIQDGTATKITEEQRERERAAREANAIAMARQRAMRAQEAQARARMAQQQQGPRTRPNTSSHQQSQPKRNLTDAQRTIMSRERGRISKVATTRDKYHGATIQKYAGKYFAETSSGTVWLKKSGGRYSPTGNPFR